MSTKPSQNFKPEVPKPVRNIPQPHDQRRQDEEAEATGTGRHLVVGRDISMSGDIASCDKLFVEGAIDATMADGRELEVAETGVFRGRVTVDRASVAGTVEGELTVRERLTLHATGRASGTVRYGELCVEVGGVLAGDVDVLAAAAEPAGVAPAAAAPTPPAGEEPESESGAAPA